MNINFEILKLGHPTLRQTALPVTDISNTENQSIFERLMTYVIECKGMGIAAPQVNISQRFFILSSHPNSRYPNAPSMEPTIIINPEITAVSETIHKDWEGCLSVPGIRALVPRHTEIDVRYTLANGQQVITHYSDFLARVFQHEYDHLNGLVFLDRVETTRDIISEHEWQKQSVKQV